MELAAALRYGDRRDPSGSALSVPVQLAHRLEGLDVPDTTEAYVVRVDEASSTARHAERITPPLGLELGHTGAPRVKVDEGLGQVDLGVVVRGRGVLGVPRSGVGTVFVPERLQVQVASAQIVGTFDDFTGFLLVPVQLPVPHDQTQQVVVTEPGRSRVTRQQSSLLGRGVEQIRESLVDLGESALGNAFSIAAGCDLFAVLLHQTALP